MIRSLLLLAALVAIIVVGIVRYMFKRAVKREDEDALKGRSFAAPSARLATPRPPASAVGPPPTPLQRMSYRQPLLRALGFDEEKVDRLIAFERQRMQGASDEQLHIAAYERWLRDNR